MKTLARLLLPPLLLVPSALTAQPESSGKPYRLFVGVDLMVKDEDDGYRPVDSLLDNEVILAEPDLPRVPLRDAGAFSWERKTKVSRAPVTIADFEKHRAFTLRNDKKMQYMATQNNMAIYQQEKADAARLAASDARFSQQIARAVYVYQEQDKASRAGLERGPPAGYVPGGRSGIDFDNPVPDAPYSDVGADLLISNAGVIESEDAMADQFLDTAARTADPTFLDRAQGVDSEEGADVMELSFTLASPDPIANAYVVVMGAIAQGEEEGIVTFHQPVGAIGPEPRKIRIRKTGFQPGFTIKEVKLHVYAYGKELATNLSERAVAMTRDQAREFLLLSHIADHAVESVPPTPVWTLAPAALLATDSARAFDYPVVVNVDADGSIISIHDSEAEARAFLAEIHDASELRAKSSPGKSLSESVRVTSGDAGVTFDQTGRLPARVVDALRDMVFLPALDIGTPVAATTKVNLADFFR